jgi:tetratricopeptide (TPR) repeat protein
VNPFAALLAVAALTAVAAAGVAAGFRRRDPVAIEGPADPLEDRRLSLLRSLADLDEARAAGALEDAQYGRLRRETESRMARLLRAIDGRSVARAGDGNGEPVAVTADATAIVRVPASGRVPPWAVASLLIATVMSVVVAGLLRDTEPAPSTARTATTGDPFAFFEDRVREHPEDLAARLDLAHRYLDAGRIDEALAEYAVALELDPDDAEARAHVGMILYLSGRPEDALASVDRALETSPDYPEALFFRGVILLCGLDRPAASIAPFEAYLAAAPFGLERSTVGSLLADAERGITSQCSG